MDAVSKIHGFQKFGWVLGLERMNVLLEKLGNPHEDLKVIHVAGTNGKGSICRYLYEVLQAAGYHCGLFTSPFLEVFNERIEFDGAYIPDDDLARCSEAVLAKAEEMVAEGKESPTEFEVVTAIAFLYFKEVKADYVVLEVGLGGSGDSTNVVKTPLASVIGSISLDHTDRLGETIAEIAGEKAGIIKQGCPVVTSAGKPEALAVIVKKCSRLQAPVFDALAMDRWVLEETLAGTRFTAEVFGEFYEIEISMKGKHQVDNAMTALTSLILLRRAGKLAFSDDALKEGMKRAKQIGRFEIMGENPYIVIDGAHNPDGAKALCETVRKHFDGKKILMVTGILADKEAGEVMDTFTALTKDFVVTEPDNPRKLDAEELAALLLERGAKAAVRREPAAAVEYALQQKENYDLILFTGSLYLIGSIRGMLNESRNEESKKSNPVL